MAHRMSRRHVLGAGITLAGAAAVTSVLAENALAENALAGSAPAAVPLAGAGQPVAPGGLPWPAANDIVAATEAAMPTFANKNFDVTTFGAKGDGKTDNTAAFAKAIAACSANPGGGHVVVPSGTYVTGAIRLKSNVDLHLNSGATLKFSGDASKYPTVLTRYEGIECMNHSPMVYAFGETNIALTGSGTLDAGGTSAWNKGSDRAFLESLIDKGVVPGSGHDMRSTFIEPYNCTNVLIQGVTLKNPMFWQLHPTLCTNVIVDGVTTDPNTAHSNTDGCDPECSVNVVIRNCTLGAHDDNIAIKSGRDGDGRRVNKPTKNVVIYNCVMNGNWGAVTCGSEITGGVQNVYAFQCKVIGQTKFALYVKSNTQRGGGAQNVNLDSISGTMQRAFAFVTMTYNGQKGSHQPAFGPITIANSSCSKAPIVFDVSGLSGDPVSSLTVNSCKFTGVANGTDKISNTSAVKFTNVTINGKSVSR